MKEILETLEEHINLLEKRIMDKEKEIILLQALLRNADKHIHELCLKLEKNDND
jgi:hypothetical protein